MSATSTVPLKSLGRPAFLAGLLFLLFSACESSLLPTEETEVLQEQTGPHMSPNASSDVKRQVAALRRATARFHRTEAAQDAGYDLVPGLDHCFTNQPVGDMGYHYIDVTALDLVLELTHPEALVYAPGPNGQLHLGGVEYIVPAEAWDAENAAPPALLGHDLHLNAALGVYVLHAWVWRLNPAGMFEDWNPAVTCE